MFIKGIQWDKFYKNGNHEVMEIGIYDKNTDTEMNLTATYLDELYEIFITKDSVYDVCHNAVENGEDCLKAINDAKIKIFGHKKVFFTDEEPVIEGCMAEEQYQPLEQFVVMGLGWLEKYTDPECYSAMYFTGKYTWIALENIKLERTWLERDKRPFDFGPEDYWLDMVESNDIWYQIGLVYEAKDDFDTLYFKDINEGMAYADSFWDKLTEEARNKYKEFTLCILKTEDDGCIVETYVDQVIKKYVKQKYVSFLVNIGEES